MNNIIVVTPQNIMPPSDGGKKCMYAHILSLHEYNDNIFLAMGNIDEKNAYSNTLSHLKGYIPLFRQNKKIKRSNILIKCFEICKWFLSGKPRQAQTLSSNKNRKKLMKFIKDNKISTIVLETVFASELIDIENCKRNDIKIILIEHNIEYKFIKDCLSKFKLAATIESHRTKKYELDIITQVDKVIAISPQDAKELNGLIGEERVQYMPMPMPKKQIGWKNANTNYIVFSGSLNFYPNYCAIKWLLENTWDKFHEIHPNITLKITGNVSDKIKKEMQKYENVVFTGFLDDNELEKLAFNTLFEIIPINKGSGIKIKLLEALSVGIPVIATKHCYDGIPFNVTEIEPYCVANNAQEFLDAMCMFIKNDVLRERYSQFGYKFYNNVYASLENKEKWNDIIEDKSIK